MRDNCCRPCKKNNGETAEESKYNNGVIAVLFPLTFFSTIVGISFLTWPLEYKASIADDEFTDIYIAGIFLTCVAGASGLSTVVAICYLHIKNFDRKRLPYMTVNYNKSKLAQQPSNADKSRVTPSIVIEEVEDSRTTSQKMTVATLFAHSDEESLQSKDSSLPRDITSELDGRDSDTGSVDASPTSNGHGTTVQVHLDPNILFAPRDTLPPIISEETHL